MGSPCWTATQINSCHRTNKRDSIRQQSSDITYFPSVDSIQLPLEMPTRVKTNFFWSVCALPCPDGFTRELINSHHYQFPLVPKLKSDKNHLQFQNGHLKQFCNFVCPPLIYAFLPKSKGVFQQQFILCLCLCL